MLSPRLSPTTGTPSTGDRARLPFFAPLSSLCFLALFTALQTSAQSISFFSTADCSGSSLKTIDSLSNSCADISDVKGIVGFTWPTDIGQILFYNEAANGKTCADGSNEDPVASLNVGWVGGCHAITSDQAALTFQNVVYNRLDNTAATVVYASTPQAKPDPEPEKETAAEEKPKVTTIRTTRYTTVTPNRPKTTEEKDTEDDKPTTTSSSKSVSKTSSSSSTSKTSSRTSTSEDSETSLSSSSSSDSDDSSSDEESSSGGSSSRSSSSTDDDDTEETGASSTSTDDDDGDGDVDGANPTDDSQEVDNNDDDDGGGGGGTSSQTIIIIASSSAGGLALLGLLALYCCCKSRRNGPENGDNGHYAGIRSWQSRLPRTHQDIARDSAFHSSEASSSRKMLNQPPPPASSWVSGGVTSRDRPGSVRTSYISYGSGTEVLDDGNVTHLEGATTILPSSSISQRGGEDRTTVIGSHMPWEAPMDMQSTMPPPPPVPSQQPIPQSVGRSSSASSSPVSISHSMHSPVPRSAYSADHQSLSASDIGRTTFASRSAVPQWI